jgi:GTPase SAR1 family protein
MANFQPGVDFREQAIAGQPLAPDSPLYVVRSQDELQAHQTILEPGALVRIRGSRGMGKTSLIQRILQVTQEANYPAVYLSLRQLVNGSNDDLDSFLQAFCLQVAEALQLPPQLDDYWDDFFGSTICCKSYFEEYLLLENPQPLVLALDNADALFPHQDLADDFFGLLRAWHEDAKTRDIWKKLRLIVAYSTDLYVPQNINKSPFNVGFPVELAAFSTEQIKTLLDHWQVTISANDLESLIPFVGGRPYLAQLGGCSLEQNGMNVSQLMATALYPDSLFADPLKQAKQDLADQSDLQTTFAAIATGQPLDSLNANHIYRLDSLGLVKVTGQQAEISCGLYVQGLPSSQQ